MTLPRSVRKHSPSLIGVLIALAALPVVWVAYWIGRLAERIGERREAE